MRVLMLGWDFSPRRSGGVGSACQGLATALARDQQRAVEVLFALPQEHGDEEPGNVRLLIGDGRWRPPTVAPAEGASAAPAAEERVLASTPPLPADEPTAPRDTAATEAPTLATPTEALRLLSIASPLRPYLGPEDYAATVDGLMRKLRPEPAPPPPPAPLVGRARTSARRVVTRSAAPARASRTTTTTASAAPAIPPYGLTLGAEVERYAREVLALVQAEDFDVVHAHDWMSFPAALLVAEQRHKPLVVHFHSCERERRGEHALDDVRRIEQAAIDAAARVVAVSGKSARTLEREYALNPAKLRVVHDALTPLAQVPAVPARHPVVLYAGRLSLQKGPDLFLAAAARVHARLPEVRFVLAGEGSLYPELGQLARKLGLADVVRFAGFLDGPALAEAYAGAAAFVMPSRAEPFGIGALEALSLGVPTLVSHDAGVTEVVRSVLHFEPEDVPELADKLLAVLTMPALAAELSRSGIRETRRLRWDRPARLLAGLYDEVVT